jgi:GTP-binding protein
VLLQDLRREPGEDEALLLSWLQERAIASAVVATKTDKLKRSQRAKALAALVRALPVPSGSCFATSAQSGEGLDVLWKAIDRQLRDGAGMPE